MTIEELTFSYVCIHINKSNTITFRILVTPATLIWFSPVCLLKWHAELYKLKFLSVLLFWMQFYSRASLNHIALCRIC